MDGMLKALYDVFYNQLQETELKQEIESCHHSSSKHLISRADVWCYKLSMTRIASPRTFPLTVS